jgi:hypothetical protein
MFVVAVSVTVVFTGTAVALAVKLVRQTLSVVHLPPATAVVVAVGAGPGVFVAVAVAVAPGPEVVVGVAVAPDVPAQSVLRLARFTDPQPVASSQPTPAGYPLLPVVTSWKSCW